MCRWPLSVSRTGALGQSLAIPSTATTALRSGATALAPGHTWVELIESGSTPDITP